MRACFAFVFFLLFSATVLFFSFLFARVRVRFLILPFRNVSEEYGFDAAGGEFRLIRPSGCYVWELGLINAAGCDEE